MPGAAGLWLKLLRGAQLQSPEPPGLARWAVAAERQEEEVEAEEEKEGAELGMEVQRP